jgi:uncharacterized protein YkwD
MRTSALLLMAVLSAGAVSAAEINRKTILEEMNRQRVAAGLNPLAEDERLVKVAEFRIRDMEELGYWAHLSPDGRSPFATLRPYGYDYRSAGENLASGFETAEVLVESWMESKGHRDNILGAHYEHCGIAVIDGSTTGRAVGRSVVAIFARPLTPIEPARMSGQ